LAAYRLLLAGALLFPLFMKHIKEVDSAYKWSHLRATVLPGILLGIHFITWITAVHMTTIVNASLIVNLVPITMPFVMIALMRERLNKMEMIATVISLAGLYLLSARDFSLNRRYFQGDLLCLFSMIFLTFYLALARKNRNIECIWLYVVPLYFFGGIFCFITAIFFVNPIHPYPPKEIGLIMGLVLIPTIIGHSILNHSIKHLRSQIVSIFTLSQFIFAGALAYIIFKEIPSGTFYVASILLVAGGYIAIRSTS